MVKYICLLRFTEQGAKNLKKSISRAHNFDKLAAKSGVKVDKQLWTIGEFDGVLVLSAENEAKVLHLLATLAAMGNVSTSTLRAFDAKEFSKILK